MLHKEWTWFVLFCFFLASATCQMHNFQNTFLPMDGVMQFYSPSDDTFRYTARVPLITQDWLKHGIWPDTGIASKSWTTTCKQSSLRETNSTEPLYEQSVLNVCSDRMWITSVYYTTAECKSIEEVYRVAATVDVHNFQPNPESPGEYFTDLALREIFVSEATLLDGGLFVTNSVAGDIHEQQGDSAAYPQIPNLPPGLLMYDVTHSDIAYQHHVGMIGEHAVYFPWSSERIIYTTLRPVYSMVGMEPVMTGFDFGGLFDFDTYKLHTAPGAYYTTAASILIYIGPNLRRMPGTIPELRLLSSQWSASAIRTENLYALAEDACTAFGGNANEATEPGFVWVDIGPVYTPVTTADFGTCASMRPDPAALSLKTLFDDNLGRAPASAADVFDLGNFLENTTYELFAPYNPAASMVAYAQLSPTGLPYVTFDIIRTMTHLKNCQRNGVAGGFVTEIIDPVTGDRTQSFQMTAHHMSWDAYGDRHLTSTTKSFKVVTTSTGRVIQSSESSDGSIATFVAARTETCAQDELMTRAALTWRLTHSLNVPYNTQAMRTGLFRSDQIDDALYGGTGAGGCYSFPEPEGVVNDLVPAYNSTYAACVDASECPADAPASWDPEDPSRCALLSAGTASRDKCEQCTICHGSAGGFCTIRDEFGAWAPVADVPACVEDCKILSLPDFCKVPASSTGHPRALIGPLTCGTHTCTQLVTVFTACHTVPAGEETFFSDQCPEDQGGVKPVGLYSMQYKTHSCPVTDRSIDNDCVTMNELAPNVASIEPKIVLNEEEFIRSGPALQLAMFRNLGDTWNKQLTVIDDRDFYAQITPTPFSPTSYVTMGIRLQSDDMRAVSGLLISRVTMCRLARRTDLATLRRVLLASPTSDWSCADPDLRLISPEPCVDNGSSDVCASELFKSISSNDFGGVVSSHVFWDKDVPAVCQGALEQDCAFVFGRPKSSPSGSLASSFAMCGPTDVGCDGIAFAAPTITTMLGATDTKQAYFVEVEVYANYTSEPSEQRVRMITQRLRLFDNIPDIQADSNTGSNIISFIITNSTGTVINFGTGQDTEDGAFHTRDILVGGLAVLVLIASLASAAFIVSCARRGLCCCPASVKYQQVKTGTTAKAASIHDAFDNNLTSGGCMGCCSRSVSV